MKIAITCDFLLERNYYTEIIEVVCELVHDAKIYTFAHREKAILGRIEQRPIQSTVMSKTTKSEKKFYLSPTYKIPLIARNLFIPCHYDLVINISNGLSQGFAKCSDTRQLTFLVDWNLKKNFKQNFFQRFFFAYLNRFARRSLANVDFLWVANESMKSEFPNAEVVEPPFKMSDYALFPKEMYPHHFYLIDTTDLPLTFAQQLVNKFESENISFQFIGPDEHLKSLVFSVESKNHFFGERCSGEHAPVLAASKAYISFNCSQFPKMALAALSTGRPVILHSTQKQWVSGAGTYFVDHLNLENLNTVLESLNQSIETLEGEKLRSQVNRFHETKFKNKLHKFINSIH
jgi:hypothetical protein